MTHYETHYIDFNNIHSYQNFDNKNDAIHFHNEKAKTAKHVWVQEVTILEMPKPIDIDKWCEVRETHAHPARQLYNSQNKQ